MDKILERVISVMAMLSFIIISANLLYTTYQAVSKQKVLIEQNQVKPTLNYGQQYDVLFIRVVNSNEFEFKLAFNGLVYKASLDDVNVLSDAKPKIIAFLNSNSALGTKFLFLPKKLGPDGVWQGDFLVKNATNTRSLSGWLKEQGLVYYQ